MHSRLHIFKQTRSLPIMSLYGMLFTVLQLPQVVQAQYNNYFAGPYAGASNTTGSWNSFVGYNAGRYNTSGYYNSFVGNGAGSSNTIGSANSFIGNAAGSSNTSGSANSFLGHWAGVLNTTGSANSFIGYEAGFSNTTGSENSFVGNQAGRSTTTGAYNSFVGSQAGKYSTNGFYNSFVGYAAGFYNTIGYNNSFIGAYAGINNLTGNNNSFLGTYAAYLNTTGSGNAVFGFQAGYSNKTGTDNVALGRSAGYNNTGSGNIFIGYLAGNPTSAAGITNAGAIGKRASVTASNSISIGSIKGVNGATTYTNIGIGTTAPAYRLHVNGIAAKPGSNVWIIASDKRLKQDIKPFTDGLEVLEKIKPVRYKYNGKADMPQEQEFVGVIAQEVQQVAPYMIGKFIHQDTTGKSEEYLDYDATALTYILVNSVKELKQENEVLKNKLSGMDSLKHELSEIKALLLQQLSAKNPQARLWQNTPNPYTQTTTIKYELPASAGSASIKVYSLQGQELHSFDISGKTQGEVTLSARLLISGTYVYTLLVDGQKIDSKKFVLTK